MVGHVSFTEGQRLVRGLGFSFFRERKDETVNSTVLKGPCNKALEIYSLYLCNILIEKNESCLLECDNCWMDFSNKVCCLCFHPGVPAPIILVIPLSNQSSVTCISVLSPSKRIKSLHCHSILVILALQILDHHQQKFSILCLWQKKKF